jgi:tetratricopeptide (TPR) repeat protein
MASLILGYEYDIFISYRQKDNKGERWVSEFVEALKTELESTFKENISIYFDVNPHDGLLETHDVDASLKDKLKCLVFIPIISRTYCDPKSFAWRNEFEAFVEQASHDQLGLKVKLPNRNVANRVLPVRIHDLDNTDLKMCESLLGGALRGVEFIYRSAGVNRPLRSEEDKPYDNLNQTIYRDQINKVANAIKEIISGLRAGEVVPEREKMEPALPWEELKKGKRFAGKQKPGGYNKFTLLSGIMAALIILTLVGVFVYPKIFLKDSLRNLRASDGRIPLAIMPFQNLSNDSTLNYLNEWIPESIASYLSNFSEDLQVRQTESIYSLPESKTLTNNSSIAPSVASLISQKLDANIIINGSMIKSGVWIIVNANLLNSKTEGVLKSFHGEGIAEEINPILDTLAQKIKDYLIVSRLKKQLNPETQLSVSTSSPEALKHYIMGRDALRYLSNPDFLNLAHEEYLKSVRIDPTFTGAYFGLITTYANKGLYDSAKFFCLKLYNRRDQMKPQVKLRAEYIYSQLFEMPYDCIKYLNQLLELDDQQPALYLALGSWYQKVNQPDKALPAFEKSLEIYNKWGIKPPTADNYLSLIEIYYDTKQNRKVERLLKKAEQDFPDAVDIYWGEFDLSLEAKDTIAANGYREKIITLSRENSVSEFDLALYFAYNYQSKKYPEKAEEYIRKAFTLVDNDPGKLNNLAWYLIIEDVNINKGLELIDQALKLMPDDYTLLDTKGWGLYKQGKFQEALKFLQKADSLKPVFSQDLFDHIQAVKKAMAGQK